MAESNQSGDVPVGHVDFGELRRVTPVARNFGFGRGLPVDRYCTSNVLSATTMPTFAAWCSKSPTITTLASLAESKCNGSTY